MTSSQNYRPRIAPVAAWHDIRGVRYHVNEWGNSENPLLTLLHGWGDCGASFQFLVDELQSHWFVIAPDWRGFGESRLRSNAYWFPDYIADLDALLSIYRPDEPVILLGHSMGANVAGLYAGVFPERVGAFINVEGFGLKDSDPDNAPAHYRRWVEQSRIARPYSIYDSYEELAGRIRRRSPGLDEMRALYVARHWAERAGNGKVVLRADPAHKLPNAVQYRRAEAEACWARITAPVLLVAGTDSEFSAGVDGWLGGRPSVAAAHVVSIGNAGHMVHLEQPQELAAEVESFLADATTVV